MAVDIYGDHLLECNHGPFQIRRNDALRDVVWHALDNTTVLCKELQRIVMITQGISITQSLVMENHCCLIFQFEVPCKPALSVNPQLPQV